MVTVRIQIISQNYYPDNFLINGISSELVKMGHSVRVLTGLPDYSSSKVPREYRWFKRRREYHNGVEVCRVPIIARRKGAFFRALNYASFIITSSLYAFFSRKEMDVIFVFATSPVFQGIPAMIYKWLTGKKSVHYCCDLWPESLKAWGISEKGLLFRAVKRISSSIYRSCDIVAIHSSPFRRYLTGVCGVADDRIVYLPQYADDLYAETVGQYEENGVVDFLFAGNLGSVQDVHVILRATALIETNYRFCVHIVGDGSEAQRLEALAEDLKLGDRVCFHGRHPLDAMKGFYKMADCFILTLRGGDFIGMTLPAKAQGYLCAGKPVLAAIDGAGKELIEQSACGAVVSAGNVEGLASNMKNLIEHPDEYKKKGLNGRNYYERHFTKAIFMDGLLNILE